MIRLPVLLSLGAAVLGAAVAHAAGSPSAAPPAVPASSGAATAGAGYHRVELPSAAGQKFPYSVELPQGWSVHEIKDMPMLWLGPEGGKPDNDPQVIYVRLSPALLGNPDEVVANFKKSVPADGSWTAPVAEVRDLGGVRGVLVQTNTEQAGGAQGKSTRKTLILKLPLPKTSVDFIAQAADGTFDKLLPDYQRILFSVRPAQ